MLKQKLQIVLITYNRKECLQKTLNNILSDNSPIKNCDIAILDNRSTDGTSEMLQEYTKKYKNITHVINKMNIGGNANTCKAFADYSDKEYIWVLCDNDAYNWNCWDEIEYAINNNYDAIMTRKCTNLSECFYEASLVSGVIYKTSNITETVIENMYCNIRYLFPQLVIMAKNINDNNNIYFANNNLITIGINPEHNFSLVRGLNINDLPDFRKYIVWYVGYFTTLDFIKDKKLRNQILSDTRHHNKSLFELFKSFMVQNKVFCCNYSFNFYQIFRLLNFKQKIQFIFAYLIINFSFKNYYFYNMRSYKDWEEYLTRINEQKYIDSLSKNLKDKKIVLYGAGMLAEILLKKYDLSKLNIVAICDKKYETTNETEFYGIKTIRPSELNNIEFDTIVFTMKLYKSIAKSLQKNGLNKKMCSIVKKDKKYAIRN